MGQPKAKTTAGIRRGATGVTLAYGCSPVYDAESIEQILSFKTLRSHPALWREAVTRLLTILAFFMQIIWMAWWDRQIWSYIGEEDIDIAQAQRRHAHGRIITEKLLALGPTFIKVGQSLSTRVDLLRKEYIVELSELQDSVPRFSSVAARAIIQEELGQAPEDLFETFENEPIAAASLGQVHRVTLKTGESAVIKVQRPNLVRLFQIDLCILKRIARFLERNTDLGRGREWRYIIDEFGRTLFEEIDYIREGRNADRFRRNFAHLPSIVVPKIFWKYTSHRVIAMEYLPGIKINDLGGLESAAFSRGEIAVTLVRAYFQQLLVDGFFHADPHPGNVVINDKGQIILYDYGMVGHIQDETRIKMVNTFLNIVGKRTDAIVKNLQDLSMITAGADLEEIRSIVDWALNHYYDIPHDQLNFEQLAEEMAEVMYYYPFRLPASFTFMFRALITLEGVATNLYPQIQFMGIAVEYAREFMQRTYLVERLFAPNSAEGYQKLIQEGLELLGFPDKERPTGSQRVRLYYDEWKPLARYIKAGFLLMAFGQTLLLSVVAIALLVFSPPMAPTMRSLLTVGVVLMLAFYLLITFATLLWLPARKKPVIFNPRKH